MVLALLVGSFVACNNAKKKEEVKFELNGTLTNLKEGKLKLVCYDDAKMKPIVADVKDGKFTMKGNFTKPSMCALMIEGQPRQRCLFYAENAKMTMTGDAQKFYSSKFTGGKVQADYQKYNKGISKIRAKMNPIYAKFRKKGLSDKEKAEIMTEAEKVGAEVQKETEAYKAKFIKENPTGDYTAILAVQNTSGKTGKEIEEMIKKLDPVLQKKAVVVEMLKKAKEMQKVEVSVADLMKNVKNVEYKVDTKFAGQKHANIIYLATINRNNVCALKKDGTISIIDANGKEISNFKTELQGKPSSIATDTDNKIYVLASITKTETKTVRGKEKKVQVPAGVECVILDNKGTKLNRLEFKNLKTATGARVVENNLMVADYRSRKISVFDKASGKNTANIEGMRPCCGILDFSVNDKKEILVANLGAFRVQAYNFDGKSLLSFGKRGRGMNEFHGCCNPVSVAYLSTGAIVTVEKDPTRIKIYSKDGAKQIQGIEELVKGCSYIPMIVDKNDNLYLASAKKGIVKCIASK